MAYDREQITLITERQAKAFIASKITIKEFLTNMNGLINNLEAVELAERLSSINTAK